MDRVKRLFKNLESGEAFGTNTLDTEVFEGGYEDRPWLYIRIEQTDKALFLPTGATRKFRPNKEIWASKIEVKEL